MTTQTIIKPTQHEGINIRWSEEKKGNKRELTHKEYKFKKELKTNERITENSSSSNSIA